MIQFILTLVHVTLITAFIYFARELLRVIVRKLCPRTNKSLDPVKWDVKEFEPPSIFVGIVDGLEPNSISVGIINTNSKTVAHQSFSLSEISLLEIESLFNENQFIPELEAIVDFIKSQTLQANNVQVLMELPWVYRT